MSLVKQLLMDKKFIEVEAEVEEFLTKAGVEKDSIVQRFEFSKKIFKDEEQVRDFVKAHYLGDPKLEEEDKNYLALMVDPIAFSNDSLKKVELRDGVMIVVGMLRPMDPENPVLMKDGATGIKFSADLPYVIELATIVDGFHPAYGKVLLTKDNLKSFKENFDNKVYGVDIMIDFDHKTEEAAGWLKEVFLSTDETTLYGAVHWTPKGALSLSEREFRYFSPEFSLDWTHPHTGEKHGATLIGGALVNRPFLKMDAIVGLNQKQEIDNMETISLKDHESKVNALEKQISDFKLSEEKMQSTVKGLKEENTSLSSELKDLKEANAKAEKEAKHKQLFDDGKINKAQLTALNEGKDMLEVLSLSEGLNTEPTGHEGDQKTTKLSAKEIELCAKMGMSEADYIKYNKIEGGE